MVRPNSMSTYALVKEKIEDELTQIKVIPFKHQMLVVKM